MSDSAPGRSLPSYLLLPRPKDLGKAWILPAAFGLGVLCDGGASAHELLRAAVVWACLELLIYQARYQWNDIRGFAADQAHPDAASRGRLPGPVERARPHIAASALAGVARLAIAAAVAVGISGLDAGGVLLVLGVAVFAVAGVYESLRAAATGRTDAVPPPLRPTLVALWIAVGGGYAVRGVGGLALAVDLTGEPALLVAAVVTMWAFGVAFVTARWAVEALAFARLDGPWVVWRAHAGQAREHLLALVRWLPARVPAGPAGRAPVPLRDWAALSEPTPRAAPWNVAILVAGAAAALTGRLLVDSSGDLLAPAAGLLLALGAVAAPAGWRWASVAAGAAALAAVLALAGTERPLLAALPWLAVLGSHAFFSGQSLTTVGRGLRGRLAARAAAGSPRRTPRQGALQSSHR
ncbi:MAG TPA: hypothetical protein VF517_10080 [Thermoleophilaceae bacterium]